MRSERRVALITGASQGIGLSLVRGFLDRGYEVVANSRSLAPGFCPGALAVAGDVADPTTAERMARMAMETFGRVDTLVNNAGAFLSRPFTDYSTDDFQSIVNVNLAGFFHLSQHALRAMSEQGHGHIVSVTASIADQPLAAVPSALAAITKGGLNAVTRALAIEYAGKGIRVNAVAPGIIDTPMHPVEARDALAGLQPMGRMGAVTDVVDAVLYLEAATFVTGEILHVDGGTHAGR